jgi:hypothetical protein
VNLFAPFTVSIKDGVPILKKSVASADLSITILKKKRTSTSISFAFDITQLSNTDHEGLVVIVTDKPGTTISKENLALLDFYMAHDSGCSINESFFSIPEGSKIDGGRDGCSSNWIDFKKNGVVEKTINNLTPEKTYYVSYFGYAGDTSGESLAYPRYDVEISTTKAGEVEDSETEELATINSDAGYLPWCTKAVFRVNIGGCFAQILYTILFKPTSFLFELTGKFFDFSFFYSVGDKAYTNTFVTGGWGIVRDFVNIFFIFVLLWIAFSTILNIHGFKTKEMIMNVVIIGILMNFSLFATRVIIDASNILARVFYSATTVTTSDKANPENKTEALGKSGEKQLSIAVVKAVDPQKLIIKAARVGSTDPNRNASSRLEDDLSKGVSVGTFILVTLLASIVNIVGMIVFLSVGLLMIGRVIGLWIAMILVPIAFFSYMVPAMKNIEAIGWSKWWDNTLKLSFLAPIFMFFMYLILKFVGGDFLPKLNGTSGTDFVLGIIVPFAFIMILMMKAKKLATQFAGDIGSMVTKAAVIGGGALVGGAALASGGIAALGRGFISNPLKMAQSSQTTRDAAIDKFKKQWYNPKTYGKAISAKMANVGLGVKKVVERDPTTGKPVIRTNPKTGKNEVQRKNVVGNTWLKQRIDKNKKEKSEKSDKAHAEHVLDEHADKIQKGKKYSELDQGDQEKARKSANKAEVAKFLFNGKDVSKLSAGENAMVNRSVDDNSGKVNTNILNTYATNLGKDPSKFHDAEHLEKTYNKVPSYNLRNDVLNMATKGTMDLRDMDHNAITALGLAAAAFTGGASALIGAGLAAHTSGLMRMGLKKLSGGMDHGTSQKDFLKDLKATLGDTLKHIEVHTKVKVKDAHGGGDDHKEDKGHGDKGGHH